MRPILLPLNYISTPEIISLVQLPTHIKYNLNKWTYHVLNQVGTDASAYLNWLQIQNKNSLNFSMVLGGVNNITKEEYQFKKFISKLESNKVNSADEKIVSSKKFYNFLSFIRKIK